MRISSAIIILCTLFFAMPIGGRGAAATRVQKSDCFPNGISDGEGERGYMRNSLGGIDSIDLKTGQLHWTTNAASVPLIVSGPHLLAFKYISENAIQIVKIDAKTGQDVSTSEPINFPDGIKVSSMPNESFALVAKVTGTTLDLAWHGRMIYEGGTSPPEHVLQKWQKQFSGIFQVDLATGNVTSKDGAKMPATLEPPRSPLTSIDSVDWKIKDQLVTLSSKQEPQGQTLFMKPADAKFTKLWSGPNPIADITADGLYVLVRSTASSSATWHIFSAETGRQIGTVPYEAGSQQACVLGDRLFYLAPSVTNTKNRIIALKAVELHSGRALWSRELKETGGGSRPLPPVVRPSFN
jgi:hypothetical protein